ncbi:sensor histidine kinase [Runella salmonicolor]|uniref:histidine kinase n=1 Tax=Runella salmonicolor TaxID=2950278 RepID=A0ABT1FHI6_9BACT|nr:ATP-binding protein [Runella salmonicolor]MCP1381232.1 ATP-binding protein [Runella salmonicolor]
MALIIRQDGNLSESLELQLKSLKIGEENAYPLETGYSLMRIGNIYRDEIDRIKAINFYNRAIKKYEIAHFDEGIAAVFMNLGILYLSSNNIDSAAKYSQLAFERSKQVVIPLRLQSDIFLLLGNVQDRAKNTASALNYWKQGLQIAIQAKDTRTKTANYLTIAQFYNREHLYDSSIYYAEKGLVEAKRISFKRQILLANKLLAVGYESKNLSKAHYHLKEAQLVNEELYGPKQVQALQKIVFEEQELQRKIEADAIAYQNQLKQYSFLAGLGVLLVIAFLLYRNNQQKQKANILLNIQKEKVEQTLETLKSTQSQLIQKEKLASLGELTAGIAHEIQNPLNFVNNFSELSLELVSELLEERNKLYDERDEELEKELLNDLAQNQEKINLHGKRASSIVKGMLEHSRQSTGERTLTNINQLADEYLRLAYHGLRAKDNTFNADYELIRDEGLPRIEVVAQEIGRVLLNLINNAFYAVNERAKKGEADYQPKVTVTTNVAENWVEIRVSDNGIGMSEATKSKIFQPFFTTKPTGEGTGLGLSLAYDIVTKGHGGMIECESVEGEGTTFIVKLPIQNS